jgi:cardiolipin synthase
MPDQRERPHILELVYLFVEWAICLVALAVVPARRTPAAARGWLLLIVLLPVIGLILFLAIGRPHFPQWRQQRFASLRPFFGHVSQALVDTGHAPGLATMAPTAELAATLGYLPAVTGCTAEIMSVYDDVIDRLVADIAFARRSVQILAYIFADDETGRRVVAALGDAARRGVVCQVLLDPVGSRHWLRGITARLKAAGVDVREALPVRGIVARTRRDMRNHRKIFVIDGETGFVGSQNIVAKDFRQGVINRELVVRVRGPVVAQLAALFAADWYMEAGHLPDGHPAVPGPTGTASVQLLPSGADYPLEGYRAMMVWQLHRARRRVVVVTPYFIPDEDILSAMRIAAARGVRVDIILSAIVDQHLVRFAQRSYYDQLLAAGIHIHLFRERLLHAKSLTIDDDLAVVGTSNVDLRSFQLNEEASLLLFDPGSIDAVRSFERDCLAASDPVELAAWRRRSKVRRSLENAAGLFSPLL